MSAHVYVDNSSRESITARLPFAPPHMRALLLAVRDFGVAWATVRQGAGRFTIPINRPSILVVGDDLEEAKGPEAFHEPSLRHFISTAAVGVVVSCEPLPRLYVHAASCPMILGRNAILIETRPECEADWVELLRSANPEISILLGTVRAEGSA